MEGDLIWHIIQHFCGFLSQCAWGEHYVNGIILHREILDPERWEAKRQSPFCELIQLYFSLLALFLSRLGVMIVDRWFQAITFF